MIFLRWRNELRRFFLASCVFLAVAGCQDEGISHDWHRIDPPVPAPEFTLNRLEGPAVSLGELKGRVVILEFWATWCAPCRSSLPSLEAIAKRYRDRHVQVLLVNVAEPPGPVRAWLEDRYEAAVVLLDRGGEVSDRYGVSSIPHLVVIDQQGRMVWSHQGYGGGLERNLSLILDQLLAEHA